MKILLIYPYFLEKRVHLEDIQVIPMGLFYIGALLKENGFHVEILNFHSYNKSSPEIREILFEKKPDLIGFSILHGNRWGGIDIAEIAKELNPAVQIVFGGAGATFLWEHLMNHFPMIDFTVIGEGEYTFLNLAQCLDRKNVDKIKKIPGLVLREKKDLIFTGKASPIKDLDSLPIPAKYFTYQHLSLTRGCLGNCTFCGSPQIWDRTIRFHSAEYFVDQMELLVQKNVTFFYVSDDTFTIKKELVIKICKEILKRNLRISWAAISHVNYVNEDMLHWMRVAGCSQISYGVESGSEKIRKNLNKNIQTKQIEKAFHTTVKYGILARAYFIYGCPDETWDTIQETIDLIQKIKPLSVIFYILDLFPGTALYKKFKTEHHIDDEIWLNHIEDIMYFENDPALTQELILAFGEKLRSSFYQNLHRFTETIELFDYPDLYRTHSEFFSKLAMTFSHGDYAKIDAIQDKEKIAENMYQKSLEYMPNHHAFLGLGIIKQKNQNFKDSIEILSKGLEFFPNSEPLNTCLGISYLNEKKYEEALSHFLKFPDSKQSVEYASDCYMALGMPKKANDLKI